MLGEKGDHSLHVGGDGANTRGLLEKVEGPTKAVVAADGMVCGPDV